MHKINQIKGNIHTAIINSVIDKGNRDELDWNIHASEIINFCPRRYIIQKKRGIPFHDHSQNITIGLAVTFQIGLAVEDFFVNSMKSNSNITTLFAYRCNHCNKTYIKTTENKNLYCPKCKRPLTKRQLTLAYYVLEDVKIIGHPDLIMKLDNLEDKFYVYELKTINPTEFESMQAPLVNHSYQVKTYLWLIKHLQKPKRDKLNIDFNYGYVVYIKKTYDNDPIKIFKIELDKKFEQNLNSIIKQLRGLEKPEKICNSPNSIIAKKCPVVKECWRKK